MEELKKLINEIEIICNQIEDNEKNDIDDKDLILLATAKEYEITQKINTVFKTYDKENPAELLEIIEMFENLIK